MLLHRRSPGVRMIKPILPSFLTSRTSRKPVITAGLPKEGTVEPLPNGKRLPTDFNEGAKNNTYSRNEKMVGYSFDHEFNDTFTVRQNLRFAETKPRKTAFMVTASAPIRRMLTANSVRH
ncbi:ferrichrome outer membrane transporter [Escherichia coli]|nr:ferrichrome outer membrane transporter [Escherichia coli]